MRASQATRDLPIDLAAAPLAVTVPAQEAVEVPVRLPATGRLAAVVVGRGAAAPELRDPHEAAGKLTGTAWVAPDERPRTVILAWHPPPPAITAATHRAAPAPMPLETGRPRFFDLAKDERRSFAVTVGQGGLYRIETLGRLKTEGWIGTPFTAEIEHQAANGQGHNMLLQTYLRAGRYRVSVAAVDSSGRAGIVANPAPLLAGATLVPGGSVRASLPAGSGAEFPVEIAAAGVYHLDLLALGRAFTARLEDAAGWPLLLAGDLSSLDQTLSPGHYRLVMLPIAVDARVVGRLARVQPPVEMKGHGPHALPFDGEQRFQWREPPSRDDQRPPDLWEFVLQGPAHVRIDISDGMVAELRSADAAADSAALARLVHKNGFAGELPAGRYRLTASSLGRNDRLDYTIALHSDELQPGRPRALTLPASVPFAIDRDRVVNLTSFGNVDVKAVLRDGSGQVIGRFDDRTDDWNIAVSRYLAAGRYVLDLAKVAPPPTPERDNGDREDRETDQSSSDAADQPRDADTSETPPEHVELRLTLPQDEAAVAAPPSGTMTLRGNAIHRLTLPAVQPGQLMLAAANSTAELMLALERQTIDGRWTTVGSDQGLSPVVAIPADGDQARAWRASLWTVDGGAEPARFAFRAINATPQPAGAVNLAPVAMDGIDRKLLTGLVAAPAAGLLRLGGSGAGVLAGSTAGEAVRPVEGGVIVPQSDRVWLVTRDEEVSTLDISTLVPAAAEPVALSLPAGGVATVPAPATAVGSVRFWLAESGFGEPALAAGSGMGVTRGTAFALAGTGTVSGAVKAWNAGGSEALRLRLSTGQLSLLPEQQSGGAFSGRIPAHSALPLRLAADPKRLRLDLPAGAAAIAGWHDAAAVTAWTGAMPASWTLDGDWAELLLANPTAHPLPVAMSFVPLAAAPAVLRPGTAEKRFFGAAGTLSLAYDAQPGQRLVVAGATATVIAADGKVRRGATVPLAGPGRIILRHRPGLVAAWIEGEGISPWPPAPPVNVTLPARLALAGATMTLALSPAAPTLLHARTTAPVIALLRRDGVEEAPALFPAGAELHRYLAAGPAELKLISPHDGPLAGSLELDATPVIPADEGLGSPVALAPAGTALFAFDVAKDGPVGVGVRGDPDRVAVRLLAEDGRELGQGVAMLRRLHPGHYLIEARLPADAETALVQPAVVGIAPRPSGPPPEVVQMYLELVGLKPTPAH